MESCFNKTIGLLLIVSLFVNTSYCFADNFYVQEQIMKEKKHNELMQEQYKKKQEEHIRKVKQIQNDIYEQYKSCDGKNFVFFETLGMENGSCKFKSFKPIFEENGTKYKVKYMINYCNMPKNVYNSFIDDIKNLDENSFEKKWDLESKKYCQAKIEDKR